MADQQPPPQTAAAPPANAGGFKLKLKLGGSNSSTTVSAAQPSSSSLTAHPSTSTAAVAPSQPTSTSTSASAESSSTAAARARNDNPSNELNIEGGSNDHELDDEIPEETEAYGGEYATNKKAAAKLRRVRKTSTPAAPGSSTILAVDANTSIADDSLAQSVDPDTSMLSNASPGPSASTRPESTKYETSIGSIVLPTSSTSTAGPSKKRRSAATEGGGTGLGRGWRKGLKGYQRGDLNSPGPGAGRGETVSASPGSSASVSTTSRKRKSQIAATSATIGNDESSLDRNADPEDFVPAMAPAGGLATSEKWANGLPGGNEQSRLTASMANAVNRQFPVGPPPKTGSAFLQPQPLDKNTPPTRSWKKVKREIIGPSGIPFTVSIWQGDNESQYADYMIEHPRPQPVDKKGAAMSALSGGVDTGSPVPEGSHPPSEGTPIEAASESGAASTGAVRGKGSARGKGARAAGPRRKPGPPKKNKALPPPIIGSGPNPAPASVSQDSAAVPTQLPDAPETNMSVDTPNTGDDIPHAGNAEAEITAPPPTKSEETIDSPMPVS